MSARRRFVKELALAAARVAQTNQIIATQRRRIARLKCKGCETGHAEDLLETMIDLRTHLQDVQNRLLHALLTAGARPAMAY
jgi:hypothetical protein